LIISKDNFQGKGRKNNQNNTETKQHEKKRKGLEKAPFDNFQGPRTIFEAKKRKMKMPKGGKKGM
jgi:hypothetical protein